MTFDPTKPVQTRDGRKARIIYYDYKGIRGESMVALIDKGNGKESVGAYYENGSLVMSVESGLDLINIPEENVTELNSGIEELKSEVEHLELSHQTLRILAEKAFGEIREDVETLQKFILEQEKCINFIMTDIRDINQRLRKLENNNLYHKLNNVIEQKEWK